MSSLVKYIVSKTYKPLVVRYLSGTRSYSYKNIDLQIPPEVFHPKFFFSTKLLLNYISYLPLEGRSFLEPGAGSGLISIYAAKNGAQVTATDINPAAVRALHINKEINNVQMEIIRSDLFSDIPQQQFDVVAVNPPYYKKHPATAADYAWYCGLNGEYFKNLFAGLRSYIHKRSDILMVLSDACDIEMISAIAGENRFRLSCVFDKKNFLERNFIYRIVSQ